MDAKKSGNYFVMQRKISKFTLDKNAYWCKNIESHADRKELIFTKIDCTAMPEVEIFILGITEQCNLRL